MHQDMVRMMVGGMQHGLSLLFRPGAKECLGLGWDRDGVADVEISAG